MNEHTIRDIARVAHEANRAYCEAMGDASQLPWDEAPEWQHESAINGVVFLMSNPNARPEDSHENWMQEKMLHGWIYGPVKNPDAVPPTHPCMVPYSELPVAQRAKDYIFRGVVLALFSIHS